MAYPTTIAAGTHVDGSIQASEDIAVEGSVQGTIELSEMLIVATGGVVRGDIHARVAHIDGVVVGTIQATERIILGPTARVQATITSPLFKMSDGAQYAGELNIGVDSDAPATVASPSTPATSTRRAPVATTTTRATSSSSSRPQARTAPAATAVARPTPAALPVATVTVVEEIEEVEQIEESATQPHQDVSASAAEDTSTEISPAETTDAVTETEVVTFQELEDDYTVKELREELRRRDLPVTGSKSELIERLLEADSQPS